MKGLALPGTVVSRAVVCKLMPTMLHEQVTDFAFANYDDFVVRNAMTERIDTTGTRRPRLLLLLPLVARSALARPDSRRTLVDSHAGMDVHA
jgi:hypothetical protein